MVKPEFPKVPWSIRDIIGFCLGWIGIQVLLMLLLLAVSPWAPPIAQFLDGVQQGQLGPIFAINLLDAAVGLGLVWLYLRRYKTGWSMVGWRKFQWLKAVGYIVAILIIFVIAANVLLTLVATVVPGFDPNQAQDNELIGAAKTHYDVALIGLVLLPPVLEETIFRGFIFPAIANRVGLVWGGVISSALFGIAHWQGNISIYTFLLGLLLCFMYVRLGSIVPGIALHMLNNFLAFMALSASK